MPPRAARLAIHWKILIGLALGVAVGLAINLTKDHYNTEHPAIAFIISLNDFVGDLFLRGLRFIAVPIVLFSLVVGAASVQNMRKLGRIGGKTIGLYLTTTAVAITVGVLLANIVRPGTYVGEDIREQLAAVSASDAQSRIGAASQSAESSSAWQTLLDLVPRNPFAAIADGNMLQIVVCALLIGVALTAIPRDKAAPVIAFCDGMTDVIIKIVHWVMAVAPYAVFALLVEVVATMGIDALSALGVYSAVVIAGLLVMMLGVYTPALRILAGVGPRRFFRSIAPAQLLAFSSSSSGATLPVTMECCEERLGVSEEVTSFVIPVGATINMDGTALYQGVAAVFIAQLLSIPLDLMDQLTIILTATLASIGTAAVPGAGMIMLVIVLQTIPGMDDEAMATGIAVIFGVDRLLDMCRTTCNVTGDCMVAAVVAATEGELAPDSASQRPGE